MTDLLNITNGPELLRRLACFLAQDRAGLSFKRSFCIAFDEWKNTGVFSLETLLGDLNELSQDEIALLGQLASELLACQTDYSISDTEIWVDAINGSDLDGNGTESKPYKSLWFLPFLPRVIRHHYRIVLMSSIVVDKIDLNITTEGDGSLSFIGAGAPETIASYVLTVVAPLLVTAGGVRVAYDLQTAGPLAPDQYWGDFLYFVDGNCAGCAVPIHSNSATDFRVHNIKGSTTPTMGDTVQVIRPSIKITILDNLHISQSGSIVTRSGKKQRVGFYNLVLDGSTTPSVTLDDFFYFDCHDMGLSFVKIIHRSAISRTVVLNCRSLNYYPALDNIRILEIAQTGQLNGDYRSGLSCCNKDWLFPGIPDPIVPDIYVSCPLTDSCYICRISARGALNVDVSATIFYSSLGAVRHSRNQTTLKLGYCLVDGKAGQPAIELWHNHAHFEACYIALGNVAIFIYDSNVYIQECATPGGGTITVSGIFVVSPSRIWFQGVNGISGALGDIGWGTQAPVTYAAWPGVQTSVNDGHGSFVYRYM
jgi:hypothetical protein